jgi:hypothetical protein
MTCGSVVNMAMWSDADFAAAYQWLVDDVPFDFTGHSLEMKIRRFPDDIEVFVALDSDDINGFGGIMFNDPVGTAPGRIETFNIFVLLEQTTEMNAGDYVQSLILIRPDGLREEIWQGTFTYTIGPSR